jgi:hypothetical protein
MFHSDKDLNLTFDDSTESFDDSISRKGEKKSVFYFPNPSDYSVFIHNSHHLSFSCNYVIFQPRLIPGANPTIFEFTATTPAL